MSEEMSFLTVLTELSELKARLRIVEERKRLLKQQQFIFEVDDKINHFSKLLKDLTTYQEQINSNLSTPALNIPEKLINTSNCLQLSYTQHSNFKDLISSKEKLEELFQDCQNIDERSMDIKYILNEIKNISSSFHNQLCEDIWKYKSARGLLDNIRQLKIENNDEEELTAIGDKSDSDLGCYPNDSATEEKLENFHLDIPTNTSPFNIIKK